MRSYLVLTVVFLGLFSQSCILGDMDRGVIGSGDVVTEEIDIAGFDGIHASTGIDVYISQGDYNVEVVADENLQEYITIEKNGSMLIISSERNIRKAKSKVVNVFLPELSAIKISSAGDVTGETDFSCKDLDISISSAGDLDLNVDAGSIDVSISSSGDCNLKGSADKLEVKLSSAGDLDAYKLIADYVDVSVSSAGDASVYANKEISMVASSAGSISYKGNAKVLKQITSSAGSINKH